MKYKIILASLFIGLIIPIGSFAATIGLNNTEVQIIADPILEGILTGLSSEDYYKYSRAFDETLKESITKDRFKQIKLEVSREIGSYLYREYLGFINKEEMTIVFWKAGFDKSPDDVLIRLVISNREGKNFVTGLWFE
ncbi:MAG: hypothetical protein ABIG64_00485 [Candidatus Omnitrophota bacterium]